MATEEYQPRAAKAISTDILVKNIVMSLKDLLITSVVKLVLTERKLEKLPDEICLLKHLRILNISHNFIRDLPTVLGSLSLTHLNASHNAIETAPYVLIKGLSSITSLDLGWNWLYEFDYPPACLSSIEEINVNNNDLYQMPPWFFHPKCRLVSINMSHNPFSQQIYEIELGRVNTSIEIFKAENCALREMTFTRSLVGLKEVYIGNSSVNDRVSHRSLQNYIKINPHCLKSCTKLSLGNSSIGSIPENLNDWKNLELIDYSSNALLILPESFMQLTSLNTIILSDNNLGFLPENIVQLVHLTTVRLDNNKLENLPPNFDQLKSLKYLDLYGNNLQNVLVLSKMELFALDLEYNFLNDHILLDEYKAKKTQLRQIFGTMKRTDGQKRPYSPVDFEEFDNECEQDESYEDEPPNVDTYPIEVSNDWIIEEQDENDEFDPTASVFHNSSCGPSQITKSCPADCLPPRLGSWRENYRYNPYTEIVVEGQFDLD